MTHTEWTYRQTPPDEIAGSAYWIEAGGDTLGTIFDEEHAKHIVTAVNSHEELLEALEKAGEYFEQRADIDGDNEKDGDEEMSLLVEIDAAIKSARGQQ